MKSSQAKGLRKLIESLEPRELFSSVTFSDGVVTLTGDANSTNKMTAEVSGSNINVRLNNIRRTYSAASLKGIQFVGGNQADNIYMDRAITTPATISAGAGNDSIQAGGGADSISGGDGNDTLYARGGNDSMHGQAGDDKIVGDLGAESITGGDGNDRIEAYGGNDSIDSGLGNDYILAGEGNDYVTDSGGANTIYGGLGDDSLIGGANSDTIYGEAGNDTLIGLSNVDVLNGGTGTNVIRAPETTTVVTIQTPTPTPTATQSTTLAAGTVNKSTAPIAASAYIELTGDPSVRKIDDRYVMVYTAPDLTRYVGGIGLSTSTDAKTWTVAPIGSETTGLGLVLTGRAGTWESQLETANLIKYGDVYYLYYCGYSDQGWTASPAQLGLATSTDGIHFSRVQDSPILAYTPGGYDKDGMYSPSVIHDGTQFVMVYAGHSYLSANSNVPEGIYILGATSPDGINWTKRQQPVLQYQTGVSPSYMANGVAEPDLVKGNDGNYYLYFTGGLGDSEKRNIGVAKSTSIFGSWTVRSTPLLTASDNLFDKNGVLAPTAVMESDRIHLWYLASDGEKHMVGYAELGQIQF